VRGTIADRIAAVRARVDAAARRAGRNPAEVTVVAVSKTFPPDAVREAVAAGAEALGENRAQELREKAASLGRDPGAPWHFVGHLQSNKVRLVVGTAALIHSVDRFGLAEAIARRARALGIRQEVLIQVNVAGEATKEGVEPARAPALASEVSQLDGLVVRGLMTMTPFPGQPDDSRPYFRDLVALGAEVGARIPGATMLSMGMSRDFEVAVEEGATIVRVGEAIFGARRRRSD
jgi:PLP dependent protein